ncbi:MAG: TIGR00341 family protein [Flavobacterium sp.]|nr:TIGR00341 family protein [Flavobacterium sp.]
MKKIFDYLNLESELDDFDIIHDKVEKDIIFKGTNLWILVFAIFVASIGLNMNSTAVIIGAMLISPLMGPIIGMGYSIATYDFPLFKTALKNFGFAVIASLIASTLYFSISPVSTAHSELLARTSPTIYDVLIAFFGGLAGIIAISSKQKGNVLPGVAIATALMPPLCTAGFGLATSNLYFFFGAFYLFTINTVFIALSSTLVCQFLKFPIRAKINEKKKRNINQILTLIILITIIPSIYFGYGLVQNEKFAENSKKLIESINIFEENYLLKSKIDTQKKQIFLNIAGNNIDAKYKYKIYSKANELGIDKKNIIFQKTIPISSENELSKSENQQSKINKLQAFVQINQRKKDSLNHLGNQLLKEINVLYPEIEECAFATTKAFSINNSEIPLTLVSLTSSQKINPEENQRIKNWLQTRLNTKDIKIIIDEEIK